MMLVQRFSGRVSNHISYQASRVRDLAQFFRTGGKAVEIGRLMIAFLLQGALIRARTKDCDRRLEKYLGNASNYAMLALKVMNIHVEKVGFERFRRDDKNYLLVANHMSYLDALIAASVLPCVFVTSEDMGEQVVLGDIAEFGGSIFIERRNRERVEQDLSAMSRALSKGFQVMIFPEGTSTCGEDVLPFKKSLLMAAVHAKVDIQPVVFRYKEVDGEVFGPDNRDSVCWYGKMDFVSHLLRVLRLNKGVRAEMQFLPPIEVRPDSTRSELAEKSHSAIRNTYLKVN